MSATKAEQIEQVKAESSKRGRALVALAAEQNDVGGPDQVVTAISAITDMLHAVVGDGWSPQEITEAAVKHYQADQTGEW